MKNDQSNPECPQCGKNSHVKHHHDHTPAHMAHTVHHHSGNIGAALLVGLGTLAVKAICGKSPKTWRCTKCRYDF